MRRYLTLLAGVLVSLGAVYLLLRGDLEMLQEEVSNGRYGYILPALFFMLLALIVRGYRWRVVVGHRTTVWHAFHIMNVGYMLNNLPLRLGELARAWMCTRLDPPIKFFTAFSAIAVERILDLIMVVILLGIALLTLDVPDTWSGIGATVAAVTLVATVVLYYFASHREAAHSFLAFFMKRLSFLNRFNLIEWLDHFLDGLQPLTSPRAFLESMGWSILGWGFSIIAGYFLMQVFFDEGSIPAIMLSVVMLSLAVAIPSTPGNLGTFEAAGVAAFWLADLVPSIEAPENAPALAYAVLLHAMSVALYIVLGMWGLYVEQTSLGQVRTGVGRISHEQLQSESIS
jgi:glycosyltransferase 2 family protein